MAVRSSRKAFIPCCDKCLTDGDMVAASTRAIEENPANGPPRGVLSSILGVALTGAVDQPQFIAVMTSKYWGQKGRDFGVRFLDNPTAACKSKILAHMNAWNQFCNVSFRESSSGEIRISRGGTGYWSYLGTDVLQIATNQATMNLQGFTENTSDAEYRRVVRHETGHTLGCPHEHMRRAIVNLLDAEKTVAYFAQTQGWSRQTTIQQVLTAVEESSLLGSPTTDQDSIMCYQLPGIITKTGKPIVGGTDITPNDGAFMAKLYPKAVAPPNPPVNPEQTVNLPVAVSQAVAALRALGFTVTGP